MIQSKREKPSLSNELILFLLMLLIGLLMLALPSKAQESWPASNRAGARSDSPIQSILR